MLFDRLCAIIERVQPNPVLHAVLKEARIFDFPGRAHELRTVKDWRKHEREFWMEHFFLPFRVVAIEDTATCVVLVDKVPGQKGLNCPRMAIEIMDLRRPIEEFGNSKDDPELRARHDAMCKSNLPPGTCSVMISHITSVEYATEEQMVARPNGTGINFFGELGMAYLATRREMVLDADKTMRMLETTGGFASTQSGVMGNAVAALEEVIYFNTPDRFIVERSAERPREKPKNGPPLLRTNERPSYILLEPQAIRKRLGVTEEPVHDRKSPTPHARRRHFRTLSSDRYTSKKGEKIVVSASWVGPEEGEYQGRKYRVCLEL